MKESIALINVMDLASIFGPMAGFMMENTGMISAMGKVPWNGRMVTRMKVIFAMERKKGMADLLSGMGAFMSEVGWMDNMKDLEVCYCSNGPHCIAGALSRSFDLYLQKSNANLRNVQYPSRCRMFPGPRS